VGYFFINNINNIKETKGVFLINNLQTRIKNFFNLYLNSKGISKFFSNLFIFVGLVMILLMKYDFKREYFLLISSFLLASIYITYSTNNILNNIEILLHMESEDKELELEPEEIFLNGYFKETIFLSRDFSINLIYAEIIIGYLLVISLANGAVEQFSILFKGLLIVYFIMIINLTSINNFIDYCVTTEFIDKNSKELD